MMPRTSMTSTRSDGDGLEEVREAKDAKPKKLLKINPRGSRSDSAPVLRLPGQEGESQEQFSAPGRTSTLPKNRPASLFGSLRSLRSLDHYDEPQSASSATSIHWSALGEQTSPSQEVIHHGEVQTSSSMFRKKKDYLVLTETHIVRMKSLSKAIDAFPVYGIIPPFDVPTY